MKKMALVLVVVALALAGCGEKTPEGSGAEPTVSGALGSKPSVAVHGGEPPKQLVIRDVVVGTGAEAKAGSKVSVHYLGLNFEDGKQFDSSWDRNQPFETPIPGRVIEGWNRGIPGMKVGGRRMLIIPSDLGYGPDGSPPVIQPNETLVFVIDLLKVS